MPADAVPSDDAIPDDAIVVADNQGAHRFELRVNGELAAFTTYRLEPNLERPERIVLVHTETLGGFTGRGLAGRLVRAELDTARSRGLRVVPRCPFVARYVGEHPEYQDLVTA